MGVRNIDAVCFFYRFSSNNEHNLFYRYISGWFWPIGWFSSRYGTIYYLFITYCGKTHIQTRKRISSNCLYMRLMYGFVWPHFRFIYYMPMSDTNINIIIIIYFICMFIIPNAQCILSLMETPRAKITIILDTWVNMTFLKQTYKYWLLYQFLCLFLFICGNSEY